MLAIHGQPVAGFPGLHGGRARGSIIACIFEDTPTMVERADDTGLSDGQQPSRGTLLDKIWRQHLIAPSGHPAGGESLLAIDRIFLHERTGSVALKGLRERGRPVRRAAQVFCTIDHIVDTRPGRGDSTLVPNGSDFIRQTRAATAAAGIRLFDIDDPDQGIVHVISPELGLALPGLTIVCPDSHTCTQGGVGAMAWGIGSTEAEHALATGTLRLKKPRSLRVMLDGTLPGGVGAKDLSLLLISRHGAAGGAGKAMEFAGSAVRALSVEARLTLCNMATEFAAMTGLVAPDDATYQYLAGRRHAPQGAEFDAALAHWRTLPSDHDAMFDEEIRLDMRGMAPMITWGTSPQHAIPVNQPVPDADHSGASREAHARALHYMGIAPGEHLTNLRIDAAFIGSCTNGRIEDLRSAAHVLEGRRVAPGVRALCVPGSTSVKRQAEAEGLDKVFEAAGFEWRESGCSLCFYAGGEDLGLGKRVVSSTNRNFEGRQGPGTRTHIASPATVAASAVRGRIADAREFAP
jgi:3-isopropylmalate/(R)-2-methylmalate dehydratase large subunit